MLKRLSIENYALIESLELDFEEGFTVITGETGAGKSILLGALSLISGQRADTKVIMDGSNKCVVEAEFSIKLYELAPFFTDNDLEYNEDICILRRELYSTGKNRVFINDSPVSLNILKDIYSKLIDIHSQHQNLLLGNDKFQLNILDIVSANYPIMADYKKTYELYKSLSAELKVLEKNALAAKEEEDYLRFQFEQLTEAKLKIGEQEELESELEILTHAEEIKSGLARILNLLDNDENGILQALKQVNIQAESTKKNFSSLSEISDRLKSDYIDLKDITSEIEIKCNDINVNPDRLEIVNNRIDSIYSLQQKHNLKNVNDLIILKDKIAEKLSRIDSYDDEIIECKKKLDDSEINLLKIAEKLSDSRNKIKPVLEKKMVSLLKQLGIPNAVFNISIGKKEIDSDGFDKVEFLFSANKSHNPKSIENTASGGELSRIMLCLKSVIAESNKLSTLFFDEIDTGVSGEIAYKMKEIMSSIASNRQVICITHLPQIASGGSTHFKVAKTESESKSKTIVYKLTKEQRINEIAQMLSGATITDEAVKNAISLLNHFN